MNFTLNVIKSTESGSKESLSTFLERWFNAWRFGAILLYSSTHLEQELNTVYKHKHGWMKYRNVA